MIPRRLPGSNLWQGNGIPSNTLGVNGQNYQDITCSDTYIKTDNCWVKQGSINTVSPVVFDQSSRTLSIPTASNSQSGLLSSSDYASFNNKQGVYYHYPVTGLVVENDIVMNIISNVNGQAPLSFKLATNGGNSYYPAIYGVAKNVSGGYADIYVGKNLVVPGFNFGLFIGVEYYLDPANPGKLTWTPPNVGSSVNPIKMGRALDATHLILDPIGNFVQVKGGVYTSDGSYDEVESPGTDGTVLVAKSSRANGLQFLPAVVASAPLTYTTATRALTITPTFTGDITASTGNVLVSAIGKGLSVKTGTNAKIGQAILVAGTKVVNNTSVTANSRIFLTVSAAGGTQGILRTSKSAGASFTITSTSATETSTVDWIIVESTP